jgi:hypothetical protein
MTVSTRAQQRPSAERLDEADLKPIRHCRKIFLPDNEVYPRDLRERTSKLRPNSFFEHPSRGGDAEKGHCRNRARERRA